MLRFSILLTFALLTATAQQTAQQTIRQNSSGSCSPAIVHNGNGPVTINFSGAACAGVDPEAIKTLNEFLTEYPKVQSRLLELLNTKDAQIVKRTNEIAEWTRKYKDLEKRLSQQLEYDAVSRRAAEYLKKSDLKAA